MSNRIFFYYLEWENNNLFLYLPDKFGIKVGRYDGERYYVTNKVSRLIENKSNLLLPSNIKCVDYLDMVYTVTDQIRDYCKQTNQTMVPHHPEDPFNHRETIVVEHEGIPIVEVRAYDLAAYGWSDQEKQKLRSEKLKESMEIFEMINQNKM